MYPGIPSLSAFKSRQKIFIGALLHEQFSIFSLVSRLAGSCHSLGSLVTNLAPALGAVYSS
jgi:hypothetical protein